LNTQELDIGHSYNNLSHQHLANIALGVAQSFNIVILPHPARPSLVNPITTALLSPLGCFNTVVFQPPRSGNLEMADIAFHGSHLVCTLRKDKREYSRSLSETIIRAAMNIMANHTQDMEPRKKYHLVDNEIRRQWSLANTPTPAIITSP